MKNNYKILTKSQLKLINDNAHRSNFFISLKKIDKEFINFNNFINAYEIHINNNLLSKKNIDSNFEDTLFESIISRLEHLDNYKKITLKIYLESQKNTKYFFTLSHYLNSYFSNFTNSIFEKSLMMSLYAISFQVWIEDDNDLEKTMSFLGNSLEQIKKIKPFFKK